MSSTSDLFRRAGGFSGLLRRFADRPRATGNAVARVLQATLSKRRISRLNDEYAAEVSPFVEERLRALRAAFQDLQVEVRGNPVNPGQMTGGHLLHLYALIRDRQPGWIVETGVCNGLSSAVILKAIERNGKGQLVSVDLPEFSDETGSDDMWEGKLGAVVPAGREPGWLVPEELRGPWQLLLGSSEAVLPDCLAGLPQLDCFIHDSEHSYRNQQFEFSVAFDKLQPGGLLIATDIQWSDAFDHFWATVRRHASRYFLDHSCAVVTKL